MQDNAARIWIQKNCRFALMTPETENMGPASDLELPPKDPAKEKTEVVTDLRSGLPEANKLLAPSFNDPGKVDAFHKFLEIISKDPKQLDRLKTVMTLNQHMTDTIDPATKNVIPTLHKAPKKIPGAPGPMATHPGKP